MLYCKNIVWFYFNILSALIPNVEMNSNRLYLWKSCSSDSESGCPYLDRSTAATISLKLTPKIDFTTFLITGATCSCRKRRAFIEIRQNRTFADNDLFANGGSSILGVHPMTSQPAGAMFFFRNKTIEKGSRTHGNRSLWLETHPWVERARKTRVEFFYVINTF